MDAAPSKDEFVRLWTANARRVQAFIFTLLPRWGDAEEILQETSLTLWNKFDEFQPGTDFTAWACRVAYLKVQEARRRQHRDPIPFSDAFVTTVEAALAKKLDVVAPRYTALLDCLQKLSRQNLDLIRRRYFAEATVASLAKDLNHSTSWVYKTLQKVHQSLYDCIEQSQREDV